MIVARKLDEQQYISIWPVAAQHLAQLVQMIDQGKISGMLASLKATSDNLKNASAEIRHSPWRLLYTPKKGEMGNLNIYDSARQFAEGANDLNDAAQALRDALHDKAAQPEQIRALMDKVEKSFGKFDDVEKKLWAEVKE